MRTAPAATPSTREGRLYTCETRTRRVTRTDKKGAIEVLAERWEGKRLNAPNDIVVAQDRARLLHRPGFRRAGRSPRARFLRRLPHPAERSDEAGGEARRAAERHCALAQRPHPLRGRTRTSATCAPTISTRTASLERARADRENRRACPAASARTRRATCTWRQGDLSSTAPRQAAPHDRTARARPPIAASARPMCKTLFITARHASLPRAPGREGRVLIDGDGPPLSQAARWSGWARSSSGATAS